MLGEALSLANIDKVFDPSQKALGAIQELKTKTDADFLGDDGNVDATLQAQNDISIKRTIDAYHDTVIGDLGTVVERDYDGPLTEKTVVFGTLKNKLHTRGQPEEVLPVSVDEAVQEAVQNAERLSSIINWWSNDAPYFASFDKDTVRVFPSRGADNIVTIGDFSLNFGVWRHPAIAAAFDGGYSATVSSTQPGGKGLLRVTSSPHAADNTAYRAIYGYANHWNHWATLDEFEGDDQEKYRFLGGETVPTMPSVQRFAVRLALHKMDVEPAEV